MLKENPPAGERRLADHVLLSALFHRSNHLSAGLLSPPDRDYAREVVTIDRLRNGMIMSDLEPAVWEKVVFSEAAALQRWEDEGGRQCGGDGAGTTGKQTA